LYPGAVFVANNTVFDASNNGNSGLTNVLFITYSTTTTTASKIYLANSLIDFTPTANTNPIIYLSGPTLIAPGATFAALGALNQTIISFNTNSIANLLNCTFRVKNSPTTPITSSGSGGIDISPYFLTYTATASSSVRINFGFDYNDPYYQVSIMGQSITGSSYVAPVIYSANKTGINCYFTNAGTYNLMIIKQYSTIA
jgi:hypothetical protein